MDKAVIKGILKGDIGISPIDEQAEKLARKRWDEAAKPLDSMGVFEGITSRCAGILGTPDISLNKRAIVAFCADNGVVEEGISQSGQEVTLAVAKAMARGESSVAKMSAITRTYFLPVNIGINTDEVVEGLLDRCVAKGTKNFAKEPAMTEEECLQALQAGIDIAKKLKDEGYEMCGIGEMGIGNTTTTAAVAAALLGLEGKALAGRGAGLSKEGVILKGRVIQEAIDRYNLYNATPFEVLRHVGGFDIAGMTGVVLGGAIYGLPIVLDGVISASCALLAERILPGAGKRTIPSHLSKESAASVILDSLDLDPVIHAQMALGEGTGAAMFFSLIDHAMCLISKPLYFDDIKIEAYTRFE